MNTGCASPITVPVAMTVTLASAASARAASWLDSAIVSAPMNTPPTFVASEAVRVPKAPGAMSIDPVPPIAAPPLLKLAIRSSAYGPVATALPSLIVAVGAASPW